MVNKAASSLGLDLKATGVSFASLTTPVSFTLGPKASLSIPFKLSALDKSIL
ncbi:hypothetical protein Barb7_01932 [Bacteroidales bacterium Barb7]|nr:hypothetical protein Barb7_01932 [Bacteroidales bacterium Barb7]